MAVQSRMVFGQHIASGCAGTAVIDIPVDDPASTPPSNIARTLGSATYQTAATATIVPPASTNGTSNVNAT
jgi:hypothetical protein